MESNMHLHYFLNREREIIGTQEKAVAQVTRKCKTKEEEDEIGWIQNCTF